MDYTCTAEKKCSFESVLRDILNGPNAAELKALGVRDITTDIVTTIAGSDNFPSSSLKGYVIQAMGKPCLFLRNKTDPPNARTCVIDLHNVHKRLHSEALHQKNVDGRLKDISFGMVIAFTLMTGVPRMIHMMRK